MYRGDSLVEKIKRIIFVCDYDTSLAPMAKAIMVKACKMKRKKVEVESRGLVVQFPEPINPKCEAILKSNGLTMAEHTSKQLTQDDFAQDTYIFTMDLKQKEKIYNEYENAVNVFVITQATDNGQDINNPYGGALSEYGKCFETLEKIINEITDIYNFKEEKQMIALGCDHGGYKLKQEIITYLEAKGYEYKDFGCYDEQACDYPVYGQAVANAVANKECEKGIIICGTGIGISIAANKIKGVRAALCHDCFSAEATRLHNDANILAMGARVVGVGLAIKIVDTFLNTEFSNDERHIRRISMLEQQ